MIHFLVLPFLDLYIGFGLPKVNKYSPSIRKKNSFEELIGLIFNILCT